ncbi:MAG: PilZ domain-containing protein [Candidatus Acidiferrum sp.]
MSKNETIGNLSMATTERQSLARAPEKGSTEKSLGSLPLDGRIEKRIPMAVPASLVIVEEVLVSERVVTVNISPHGARVVSKRHWRPEEQPWLASLTSYFRLQGSVVYCQPLTNGDFCVGLKFRASYMGWEDNLLR